MLTSVMGWAQKPVCFSPATHLAVGSDLWVTLAVDLNKDGNQDIVTGGFNSIKLAYGDGKAGFDSVRNFAVHGMVTHFTLGDLNGDGWQDIICTLSSPDRLAIYLAKKSGGFEAPTLIHIDGWAYSVSLGHFNNDQALDIALSNPGNGTITVALNNGSGVFKDTLVTPIGHNVYYIKAVDINADHWDDIVYFPMNQKKMVIIRSLGNGRFSPLSEQSLPINPTSAVLGKINGDDFLDIVLTDQIEAKVYLYMGQEGGKFGYHANVNTGGPVYQVVLSDVNRDGHMDVVTANGDMNSVTLIAGLGGGAFGEPETFKSDTNHAISIAVTDLTSDMFPEIVVGNHHHTMSILENCSSTGLVALQEQSVKVYPNPAGKEEFVRISFLPQGVRQVNLFNAQGRILASWEIKGQAQTLVLPIQGMESGMYFVQWLGGENGFQNLLITP